MAAPYFLRFRAIALTLRAGLHSLRASLDGCALSGLHSLRSSLDGCALSGLHSLSLSGVISSHRAIAGNEPPINNVGGSRHAPATMPLNTRPAKPSVAPSTYKRATIGTANNTNRPRMP